VPVLAPVSGSIAVQPEAQRLGKVNLLITSELLGPSTGTDEVTDVSLPALLLGFQNGFVNVLGYFTPKRRVDELS
jgi:hypothetical protein